MTQEEAERMYVNGLLKVSPVESRCPTLESLESRLTVSQHWLRFSNQILKGYSDRTQAVELIRELETFSLDPRAMVMSGEILTLD
jgi:hypothetical protein